MTLEGIIIFVKPLQPENALSPIFVTPSFSVIFSMNSQFENAYIPISPPVIVTSRSDSGMLLDDMEKIYLRVDDEKGLLPPPTNGSIMVVSDEHFSKAPEPIALTVSGTIILEIPEQR